MTGSINYSFNADDILVLNQNPVSSVSVFLEVIEAFLESLVTVLSGRNHRP